MAEFVQGDYEFWLREQPEEFIKETLGEEKAELFINGGQSFGPFQITEGTEITMKKLSKGNQRETK